LNKAYLISRPINKAGSELGVWKQNMIYWFLERQILRKVLGPMRSKERWRIINKELQQLIRGEYIVKYIKEQRIKFWGYLNGMEDVKLVKKITDWNPTGLRAKARPKNRWRDEVIKDLKKLKL